MSEYEVNFIATYTVQANSEEEAIQEARNLFKINLATFDFVVDDMDALKAEVRKQAIIDAKEKAKALSKELDVKFDEIISFYETGEDMYPPIMSERAYGGVMAMDVAKVSPSIPTGENKLKSQVTITYSIK